MNRNAFIAALACITVVAGCSLMPSPAVGEWTGTMTAAPQSGAMGALATGMISAVAGNSADLTLKADGTGYVKAMSAPEHPITWKMDGDRILIYGMGKNADNSASPAPQDAVIARLSEDKKTLTLDAGPLQFNLAKKAK